MIRHWGMLTLMAAAAAGLTACTPGGKTLAQRLQDEDPKVRIAAAVEAGQTGDKPSVALLVERLDDSEADVRFYAIAALERVTGQTLGYKCYEPLELRRAAQQRWRKYVAETRKDNSNKGTSKMPVERPPRQATTNTAQRSAP